MVAKRNFSDRFLKSVKPAPEGKRVIIYDGQVPGFGLRISDKSTKESRGAFVLVARYPGSQNPAPRRIGDFPAMSLATARQTAREWRTCLSQGVDPKEKEAERQRDEKRRKADTFEAVFEAFAADHLCSLRTGKEVEASVRKHVFPSWASLPITSIKRGDVNALIRGIRSEAPIAANRVLAYLKKFFGWAVDQDLLDASPAAGVKRPAKETRRDRVLTENEIRAIWAACDDIGAFGAAFKLMLLTAQRRSEVAGMAWSEIDTKNKNWALGRERTKADRSHDIPLSSMAMAIIETCPKVGGFVLATGRSLSATKGEAAQISGWSKAKRRLDDAAAKHFRQVTGDETATFSDWHLHDLRRTAATYLAKLGIDRVVISKVLNHAEGGVTSIYDRHAYEPQKRRALDLWAEHLAGIVSGAERENVVAFTGTRG